MFWLYKNSAYVSGKEIIYHLEDIVAMNYQILELILN